MWAVCALERLVGVPKPESVCGGCRRRSAVCCVRDEYGLLCECGFATDKHLVRQSVVQVTAVVTLDCTVTVNARRRP